MFGLLVPASASAAPSTHLIVQREPGLNRAEQTDIRSDAGVRLVRPLELPRTELVATTDPAQALATLRRDDDVVFAQVDHVRRIAVDSRMPRQWALDNTGQSAVGFTAGVPDADIDADLAWLQNILGTDQEMGIVDTGVDDSLSDLAGQVLEHRDFIGGGAGVPGGTDGNGHGTHVAGIMAAAQNGTGISGVAPEAKLMALKALDDDGSGSDSDIADAMVYAGQQGIRVVNLSLGGTDPAPALDAAIDGAPDTLFVVAAGNEGADDDADDYWPCNSDAPNVICVGASTNKDHVADFSNYGATTVDLFAPGDGILSTVPEGTFPSDPTNVYAYKSGTSMAAPHVAAVAALVMQANPTLTVTDVAQLIFGSVDQRDAFAGKSVTGGRLNAAVAVAAALSYPDPPVDTDDDGVVDAADVCPDPGDGTDGCPARDADNDGAPDTSDNCPALANSDQHDDDHDGVGNACDSTPRGADSDGDGVGALDDHCPTVKGVAPTGCPKPVATPTPKPTPTPTPPPARPLDSDHDGRLDSVDQCRTEPASTPNGCPLPYVTALSAKGRKRAATLSIRTSRAASVRITVQRKRGHRWVKVTRRVRTAAGNRVTLKLKHLRKGSYRVVVVLSSPAGRAAAATKRFRVR